MSSRASVVLGHVVGSGERFHIPIAHTVITGITQQGKTTAEEAIFSRLSSAVAKEYKVLVFLTKRGEKTFHNAHTISPFYRERFDWEYVRSLLESTMKERLKFETPWIIRICKQAEVSLKTEWGAQSFETLPPGAGLKEVRKLLAKVLTSERLKDFDRNIYTLLAAYLDKVLPVLEGAQQKFIDHLDLKPGINVMDLTEWYVHEEVQMLVIRSCMEEILRSMNDTIIVLPEAWKMLPQARNTPVKVIFEKYVREGATNNNYLYLDAQDLGGMDKTPLRQVSVWIMGRMLEANEVKRLLKQTLGVDVKPEEIQTLPLGHFLVAAADKVTKVYVWPVGIPEEDSVAVAQGKKDPETIRDRLVWHQKHPGYPKECQECTRYNTNERCANCSPEERNRLLHNMNPLSFVEDGGLIGRELSLALNKHVEALSRKVDSFMQDQTSLVSELRIQRADLNKLEERVDNLSSQTMPGINANSEAADAATLTQKTLTVTVEKAVVDFTLTTEHLGGKIMWLAKDGFLDEWRTQKEVEDALTAKGWGTARITVYKALQQLVDQGFIGVRKTDRAEFKLAPFVTFKEE